MKALIKQTPKRKAEVFFETDWLDWMDPDTGAPLNQDPYGYALAEDAPSEDPMDYDVERHEGVDEYGDPVVTYTARIKAGWTPGEE